MSGRRSSEFRPNRRNRDLDYYETTGIDRKRRNRTWFRSSFAVFALIGVFVAISSHSAVAWLAVLPGALLLSFALTALIDDQRVDQALLKKQMKLDRENPPAESERSLLRNLLLLLGDLWGDY